MKTTNNKDKNGHNRDGDLASSLKGKTSVLWAVRSMIVLLAALLSILNWRVEGSRYGFAVDSPASRTFLAVNSMRYFDAVTTEAMKKRISERVVGVFVQNPRLINDALHNLEAISVNRESLLQVLSPSLIDVLESLNETRRGKILEEIRRIGMALLNETFQEEQRATLIWDRLDESELEWPEKNIVYQVLDQLLLHTQQKDLNLTWRLRREMEDSVQPIERTLLVGDVIVEKGERITPFAASLLKAQGYTESAFPYRHLLLTVVVAFLWSLWLSSGLPESRGSPENVKQWLYVLLLLALAWVIEIAAVYFRVGGLSSLALAGWAYLTLPAGFAFHLALGGSALGALVAAGMSLNQMALIVMVAAVVSGIGYFRFHQIQSRVQLWRELFLLGILASCIELFIFWSNQETLSLEFFLRFVGAGAFLSAFVLATLPFWENLFDVLSPLRLIELSHPSSPLLKRLQIEAPGTYHHTLMVGTLAEAAADRLGLNSLLVKAGAYYHDIGKLRRPHFFVENQMYGENAHDGMAPSLSSLVIISHVRDGYELAAEYHLPALVKRFILEHHGTTCLSYFYRKAVSKGDTVPREQFCYPGPRPQSKETGLVMFADSVEAAVRAAGGSIADLRDLERTVQDVMDSKLREEQLMDVDFTLRDLRLIREAFVATLRSMYHSRQVRALVEEKTPVVKGA